MLEADAAVALPKLTVAEVPGLPRTSDGFLRVDAQMRVGALEHVWAAGDVTSFPVKQGGLAAQQAAVAARTIAAKAGAHVPIEPWSAGRSGAALITGGPRSSTMRAPMHDRDRSEVSEGEALWSPPAKIAGPLSRASYLARGFGAGARPSWSISSRRSGASAEPRIAAGSPAATARGRRLRCAARRPRRSARLARPRREARLRDPAGVPRPAPRWSRELDRAAPSDPAAERVDPALAGAEEAISDLQRPARLAAGARANAARAARWPRRADPSSAGGSRSCWRNRESGTRGPMRALERADLDRLLAALVERGYELIGPTVRQGAIVVRADRLQRRSAGRPDRRPGGRHLRLERRGDEALFGFANGPQSWKRLLHPPALRAVEGPPLARRRGRVRAPSPSRRRSGRSSACAPATCTRSRSLDRVLLEIEHPDPDYAARREGALHRRRSTARRPAGPASASRWRPARGRSSGFDLALTELLDDGRHRFLVEGGSERGAEVLAELPTRRRRPTTRARGRAVVASATAASMGRRARHRRAQGAALPQPRAPALGRGLRALPHLRQLHDGLPDLLLHRPSRTSPTSPATRPSACGAGTRASRSSSPTCTAAASAPRPGRATASG